MRGRPLKRYANPVHQWPKARKDPLLHDTTTASIGNGKPEPGNGFNLSRRYEGCYWPAGENTCQAMPEYPATTEMAPTGGRSSEPATVCIETFWVEPDSTMNNATA